MTETLVMYMRLALYSAMAVYTLAFILFTVDLARRSAAAPVAATVGSKADYGGIRNHRPSGEDGCPGIRRARHPPLPARGHGAHRARPGFRTSAAILRGLAAGRVPWANMFEFTLTATAIIVGVFLAVQFWQDLRFLGAFISGFVLIALGVATVNYVDVVPLPPALQSAWLVIHVFVATLGTGFFALGAGLSIVQVAQGGVARSAS